MNAMTGWRLLRTPSASEGNLDSSRHALLHAGAVLAAEHLKKQHTGEVKDSLRDLAANNHFADLIATVVKDNSTN